MGKSPFGWSSPGNYSKALNMKKQRQWLENRDRDRDKQQTQDKEKEG